jgi:hypothetical protein
MTLAKAATSLGGLDGLKFRRHVKRIPHKSDDIFPLFSPDLTEWFHGNIRGRVI